MKVSEIFYSIQGEGKLMGVPSAFLRVSGCNLRCAWCDTPYASWDPQGEEMMVPQIIDAVHSTGARYAVITGGEPMIMSEIGTVCAELKRRGMHVTVETAATVFKAVEMDLASLSPKLSNSTPVEREGGRFARAHDQLRMNVAVVQSFIDTTADFQLKFVVSAARDVEEIDWLLGQLKGWTPADVLLMPEGTEAGLLRERALWVSEICKERGFRYCPRLHVELYGNRRGT